MRRARGPALLAALLAAGALPAAAAAAVSVSIDPPDGSDALYEDQPLSVRAAIDPASSARVVVKFHDASTPCGADPAADPGVLVADGPTTDGEVSGTATAPDPGRYVACAWQLDSAGAVADRGETAEDVAIPPAEATVDWGATRVWRGVPVSLFATGSGLPGRVLQAAILRRAACPYRPPAEGDPAVVRWIGGAGGQRIGDADRELAGRVALDAAGDYSACSWVGEAAGDPAPEAVAAASLTVVAARARTVLGLRATRSFSNWRKPVLWSGYVHGAFSGVLRFEAQKVVHGPRGELRGSGPWRPVASFDLAGLRPRPAGRDLGLQGDSFLAIARRTRLPVAIGRQCGNQARIARVRLHFLGSALARPALSRPVQLSGSLGGC